MRLGVAHYVQKRVAMPEQFGARRTVGQFGRLAVLGEVVTTRVTDRSGDTLPTAWSASTGQTWKAVSALMKGIYGFGLEWNSTFYHKIFRSLKFKPAYRHAS